MSEAVRIGVVILGGASFGVALIILRHMTAYVGRAELFILRLIVAIHGAVVVYIAGVLTERVGEPMSWQTPAAAAIFSAKLVALLAAREVVTARRLREEPPTRRAEDETPATPRIV